MGAAEVVSDEPTEKTMEEADGNQNQGDVDTVDESEQTGIASQFITEQMEGAQTFFGLTDKIGVALKGTKTHRVVDMCDGDMVGMQLLAKEHILIAIITETLVEGMGEHQIATDEKVGSMEILIGILLAHICGMLMLGGFLVEITEIAFECFSITADGYTPVNDIYLSLNIFVDKVCSYHRHVAIDEEQVIVLGLVSEIVPDGRSSNVL